MEIEEVKIWQWMLAGLIAGILFSCVIAWKGPGIDDQHRDTVMAGEFENRVYPFAIYKKTAFDDRDARSEWSKITSYETYHKDQPLLRSLIVHPPDKSDKQKRYCITGEFYAVDMRLKDQSNPSSGQELVGEWKPFQYAASTPYIPGYSDYLTKRAKNDPENKRPHTAHDQDMIDLKKSMGNRDSFPTVLDYFNAAEKLPSAKVTFRQAWWELPKFLWSMPALAGFLCIGVAWPMTLTVLQNFGVAKPPPVKAKPKLAQKPQSMNIPSTSGVILGAVAPPPPPPPTDVKEYGGEFYPVVKVHHEEVKPTAAAKPTTPKPKPAPAKAK